MRRAPRWRGSDLAPRRLAARSALAAPWIRFVVALCLPTAACGAGGGTESAARCADGACSGSSSADPNAGDPGDGGPRSDAGADPSMAPSTGATGAGAAFDAACPPASFTTCVRPAPSYAQSVAPILAARCARTCHSPDGGEWPLTDYAHVVDWSLTVGVELASCAMPPPDAGALPLADRALVLDWIACGSPYD